jgi:hypothetical protein
LGPPVGSRRRAKTPGGSPTAQCGGAACRLRRSRRPFGILRTVQKSCCTSRPAPEAARYGHSAGHNGWLHFIFGGGADAELAGRRQLQLHARRTAWQWSGLG